MRSLALLAALALCCAALTGCWDYRGLDELTIVAGIAVDLDDEDPEAFRVTFEVVDTQSASKDQVQSAPLESRGLTLTEAVHNANKRLHNNMFFGNAALLVISEEVARDKGLQVIIDPLLRDYSIRDNMMVLVSREKTACEIITPLEDGGQIVSFQLNKIIGASQENAYSANSTRTLELDQIYNNLSTEKTQLALPAVRFSNREKKELRLDGLEIFLQDRAVGVLEDRDTPWFLLATERLKSGSINVFLQEEAGVPPLYYTLSIDRSAPKHRCDFDGETFTFTVELEMRASVTEFSRGWGEINDALILQLEERAETVLNENIRDTIERLRDETGSDCLGFGAAVANHSAKLWSSVEADWEQWFRDCEVVVQSHVFIEDTGHMKGF